MAAREEDLKGLGAHKSTDQDVEPDARLKITLVSDESYRLACLQGCMRAAGLSAELSLRKPGHATAAALRRKRLDKTGPELVLLDFTRDDVVARRMLKSIAFGEKRSRAAVGILTSPETERLLEAGEIDGGEATMFSPTRVDVLLGKLTNGKALTMLRSIGVLNQYGPVLIRAREHCEACDAARQSA